MSMIDLTMPGETEMGSAGEQPIKGYLGKAHQTVSGRGVTHGASPTIPSSDDRPAMPGKTHPENCGIGPQTCVQGTGRGTSTVSCDGVASRGTLPGPPPPAEKAGGGWQPRPSLIKP